MADLPEIPDEAIEAACLAQAEVIYGQEPYSRRQAMIPVASVRAGLRDAWPHLYAAALRHVADDLEAQHCSFAGLTYLRELADLAANPEAVKEEK